MPGRNKKITIGLGLCDGCGKCIEACKGKAQKKKAKDSRGAASIKLMKNGDAYMPVICRNCEGAPCVASCMTGCRQRNENGRVTTDYRRCIGCWMCIMSCPFGAIEKPEDSHSALKCEGCLEKEIAPCVAACKKEVLIQEEGKDVARDTRRRAARRFLAGDSGVMRKK